jgi:hypothetical protein
MLTSSSGIELSYYISNGDTLELLCTDSTIYRFSNTNADWYGINHVDKEYGGKERYYYYKFAPKSFTLYNSSTSFATLRTRFNNLSEKGKITIYAIPKITLYVKSENSKNNVKQVTLKGFKYNNVTSKSESTTVSRTTLKSLPTSNVAVKPTCEYYVARGSAGENDHKSTTICDNGIVFTSGKYVFGIGYGENIYNHGNNTNTGDRYKTQEGTNIWGGSTHKATVSTSHCINGAPILFYADTSAAGVGDWIKTINKDLNTASNKNSKQLINFGYNRAINAIPLEDIFKAIKLLRSRNDSQSWSSFGL